MVGCISKTARDTYSFGESGYGVSEWVFKDIMEDAIAVYSRCSRREAWGGEDGNYLKYFFRDEEELTILGLRIEKPTDEIRSVSIDDLSATDSFQDRSEAEDQDFEAVRSALSEAEGGGGQESLVAGL